jgi:putative DNA primase/helicase
MSDEVVRLHSAKSKARQGPTAAEFLDGAHLNEIVTEDQAALEFANRYAGGLRYDHDVGAWYLWDGVIWRQNKTGIAFHWARELARELAAKEPDRIRYVASKVAFASAVERAARSDPVHAVTSEVWNRDPFLLGSPGGTIDLRTGFLRPAKPEDGITKSVLARPAETAGCPLWLRFLKEATSGDVEMIRFLQQWCGYCLTGDVREHALVFVHGGGGNGKGVFLRTIVGILDSYAVTAAMDTFMAAAGERHSTDVAMFCGARLVTAQETEEGRPWAEAKIKALTGGDPITARFMRCDNFTFQPTHKLTFSGNHQPVLHGVDDALQRRFHMVPFTNKPKEPDKVLEEKLKAEWPGVLRWMIDGCLDWQKNGLVPPQSVKDSTTEYFANQNLFAQWLEDLCDAEPGNGHKKETSAALFKSYAAYMIKAGEKPPNRRVFADTMEKRGFRKDRGTAGVRMFAGVRFRNPGGNLRDDDDD